MQTSGQERHIFLNESVFILKLGVLQVRHPSAGNTWSTTCSSLRRITEYPRLEYPQVSPNPTSAQGSEESPLEVLENLCGCSTGGHGWGDGLGLGLGISELKLRSITECLSASSTAALGIFS